MDHELNLADPTCHPRRYAADLPVDALAILDAIDGGGGPIDEQGQVGDRDRTLLGAAEATDEEEVVVLTDDEDFFNWVMDRLASQRDTEVSVYPKHSIDFMGELHRCRAISFEVLATIADVQEAHVATYLEHGTPLSTAKLHRIQQVVIKAAAVEARRGEQA